MQHLSPDFFEHNGFKEFDDTIICGGQAMAEKIFTEAPFKAVKSNCVIIFKKEDTLFAQIKRDYNSAVKQAKELMEQSINSIIYIFTFYPKTVKHIIVTDGKTEIQDYEGKGNSTEVDVRNIKTDTPFDHSQN